MKDRFHWSELQLLPCPPANCNNNSNQRYKPKLTNTITREPDPTINLLKKIHLIQTWYRASMEMSQAHLAPIIVYISGTTGCKSACLNIEMSVKDIPNCQYQRSLLTKPVTQKVFLLAVRFVALICIEYNVAAVIIKLSNIYQRHIWLHIAIHLPHLR